MATRRAAALGTQQLNLQATWQRLTAEAARYVAVAEQIASAQLMSLGFGSQLTLRQQLLPPGTRLQGDTPCALWRSAAAWCSSIGRAV